MPTSQFSLGQDTRVVIIDGTLGRLNIGLVVDFKSAQQVKTVNTDPLNMPPLQAHLPGGWTFSFSIDRANSVADDAIAALELAYWNEQTVLFGTLYQYTTEINGSTSTYQYNNVTYHLSDAGTWTQNQVVKQTITGWASTRYRI
jgi:hypothetical protein